MDVHVKIDTKEIDRRAVEAAKSAERAELDKQLGDMFRDGHYLVEGVGRTQIREKIEAELEKFWDSEKCIANIERRIAELVPQYVDEVIHTIAKHRARKIAFYQFNEYLKGKAE